MAASIMVKALLSLAEAKKHLLNTSVISDGEQLPLCSSPQAIGAATGGVGIQLYFLFLKYIRSAFAIYALFHLPIIVIFARSTGGADATAFDLTSAFNTGIPSKNITAEVEWNIRGFGTATFEDIVLLIGILDAAGLLCFIIIISWFVFRTMPKIVQKFDDENVTPSDFTIEVSGLPSKIAEHEHYEEELRQHFVTVIQRAQKERHLEPYDERQLITECCLVRNYNQRLLAFQKLDQLQIKLDNAKERNKKEEQIKKIEDKMNKLRSKKYAATNPIERNVCKRAYVMFNKCEVKELIADYYRFGNFRMCRYFQKKYMRFHGCALKIIGAPEPGNIMWENMDRNELHVAFQMGITFLLALVMFAVSFVIIFATKAYTKELQEALRLCEATGVTVNNWRDAIVNGTLDRCVCQEIGLKAVYDIPELQENYCKQWFQDDLLFKALAITGAFIVVIVNLLLQIAVTWLTKLEQPLSVSAFHASLAFKIAIAQFFNTGIIVLLVNSTLFRFTNLVGQSGFEDFEREWYKLVGKSLTITLLIQAFSPHLVQVCLIPLLRCRRRCKAATQKTQRDLNALYSWPQFNLAVRLGGLINVTFCTLLYSAGLPLLSFTAFTTFFLVYHCDKLLLLRASKMPPTYNEALIGVFARVIPFACFLHATLAIYMLGNQDLFPGKAWIDREKFTELGIFEIQYLGLFLERCLVSGSTGNVVMWLLIVAFLVIVVLKTIMGATFGTVFEACCAMCSSRQVENKDLAQNKAEASERRKASLENKHGVLFSYDPERNPRYAGLVLQANVGDWTKTEEVEEPMADNPVSVSAV